MLIPAVLCVASFIAAGVLSGSYVGLSVILLVPTVMFLVLAVVVGVTSEETLSKRHTDWRVPVLFAALALFFATITWIDVVTEGGVLAWVGATGWSIALLSSIADARRRWQASSTPQRTDPARE